MTSLFRVPAAGWLFLCILVAGHAAHAALAMPAGYRELLDKGTASGAYASVAVGLVQGAEQQTWFIGKEPADAESAFEIGAVSDVFTGILLARAALDGKVRLGEPIDRIWPGSSPRTPTALANMPLSSLATQQSGLPAAPSNLFPVSADDPYANYAEADLFGYLAGASAAPGTPATPAYSVLNAGLLGVLLAHVYGGSFADVLDAQVLKPLALAHTGFADTPGLLGGHAFGKPVAHWHYSALSAAAGLRSTLDDLLAFVRINLQPEKSPLRAPLLLARQARAQAGDNALGLGWNIHEIEAGDQTWPLVWRASESGGFSAFVGFRTDRQQGLVLLSNSAAPLAAVGVAWLSGAQPPEAPSSPYEPKAHEIDAYPGLYRLLTGADVTVRSDGAELTVQLRGAVPWPLVALAEDVYATRDGSLGITFVRNVDAISGLLLRANGRFVNAQRLSAHAPRLVRPAYAVDAHALADYRGDYLIDADTMLRVQVESDALAAQFSGSAPMRMRAYAPDRFADDAGTNGLTFERDEHGRISAVIIDLAGGEHRARAPRAGVP